MCVIVYNCQVFSYMILFNSKKVVIIYFQRERNNNMITVSTNLRGCGGKTLVKGLTHVSKKGREGGGICFQFPLFSSQRIDLKVNGKLL